MRTFEKSIDADYLTILDSSELDPQWHKKLLVLCSYKASDAGFPSVADFFSQSTTMETTTHSPEDAVITTIDNLLHI